MKETSVQITTQYLVFASRSFAYTCWNTDLLKRLSKHCKPINQAEGSVLAQKFINSFLSLDELPISKQIFRFDYEKNKASDKEVWNISKNNEFVLFLLDEAEIIENLSNEKYQNNARKQIKGVLTTIKNNANKISNLIRKNDKQLNQIIDSILDYIDTTEFNKLKKRFKDLCYQLSPLKTITNSIGDNDSFSTIDSILKKMNEIEKFLDVRDYFTDKIKVFALVSKTGAINISLVTYSHLKASLSNKIYNPNDSNQLISEAITNSEKIISSINRLPKIISFLNLNAFLGFNNKCFIFDYPNTIIDSNINGDEYKKTNIFLKLSNKTSTHKAVFLKTNIDTKNLTKKDDSPMVYYDYLSLLVAFHKNYDPNTLWEYVSEFGKNSTSYIDSFKNSFEDLLNKPTEHLFFDDCMATLSAIDETININKINSKLTNPILKEKESHQIRLYSIWDFEYICNALAYSSICILIDSIFIDYIKKVVVKTSFKPFLNLKQSILARIFSRIDSNFNHTSFSLKVDSNKIIDSVFENTGLIRIEKALNETADINWRSGNLLNTQVYQRYGILFSIIGISITVFAFGLISLVDTSKTSESTYLELFNDIFTNSPKIPVVLTIIAVPIFIWLVWALVEMFIIKFCFKNISKLDGLKARKIIEENTRKTSNKKD